MMQQIGLTMRKIMIIAMTPLITIAMSMRMRMSMKCFSLEVTTALQLLMVMVMLLDNNGLYKHTFFFELSSFSLSLSFLSVRICLTVNSIRKERLLSIQWSQSKGFLAIVDQHNDSNERA